MLNHNAKTNTANTFVVPQIIHRTLVTVILQPIHYLKRPYQKYISETMTQAQEKSDMWCEKRKTLTLGIFPQAEVTME